MRKVDGGGEKKALWRNLIRVVLSVVDGGIGVEEYWFMVLHWEIIGVESGVLERCDNGVTQRPVGRCL